MMSVVRQNPGSSEWKQIGQNCRDDRAEIESVPGGADASGPVVRAVMLCDDCRRERCRDEEERHQCEEHLGGRHGCRDLVLGIPREKDPVGDHHDCVACAEDDERPCDAPDFQISARLEKLAFAEIADKCPEDGKKQFAEHNLSLPESRMDAVSGRSGVFLEFPALQGRGI